MIKAILLLLISLLPSYYCSFEHGFNSWIPDADVPLDPNRPGQYVEWHIDIVSNISHSGQNSLRFYVDGSQDDGTIWIEKKVINVPYAQVTMTLWLYSVEESEAAVADVVAYGDSSNPEFEEQFTSLGPANQVAGWKKYTCTLALPAAATEVWFAVGINLYWETQLTYYIDDIQISA